MGEKMVRSKHFRRKTMEWMMMFFVLFRFFLLCLFFFLTNCVRNVVEKQQEKNVKDSSISQYQSFANKVMESSDQIFAT